MKKTPLINSEISAVIVQLGHTDTIVIGAYTRVCFTY